MQPARAYGNLFTSLHISLSGMWRRGQTSTLIFQEDSLRGVYSSILIVSPATFACYFLIFVVIHTQCKSWECAKKKCQEGDRNHLIPGLTAARSWTSLYSCRWGRSVRFLHSPVMLVCLMITVLMGSCSLNSRFPDSSGC